MGFLPLQGNSAPWRTHLGTRPLRAVGVDLSGSEKRPTGWASLRGPAAETALLRTDDEIVSATLAARPRVVSLDCPLSVPPSGIIRESERELMALRVGVYPCLLPSMRALTARGMRLKTVFESHGLTVIEGFPGAAQDSLGIPRKKTSLTDLRAGLAAFGLTLPPGVVSHHELDAVTAALIGQFYTRGRFHAFGAPGEVPIITPLVGRRTLRLVSADAATLRFAANYLALFHGIRLRAAGSATAIPAFPKRAQLRQWLYGLVTNASMSLESSASAGL